MNFNLRYALCSMLYVLKKAPFGAFFIIYSAFSIIAIPAEAPILVAPLSITAIASS